jgi:hypothetical protein
MEDGSIASIEGEGREILGSRDVYAKRHWNGLILERGRRHYSSSG